MQYGLHETNDLRTKSLLVAGWALALGCLYVGITNTTIIVNIYGFNLHTLDIAVATAIITLCLSARCKVNRGLSSNITLLFCGILSVSVLLGIVFVGNPALLEGRSIVTTVLWLLILCFSWDDRVIDRLIRINIQISLVLSLLCFLRLAFGNELFVTAGLTTLDADSDRPLIGTPAMTVGFACMSALSIALNDSSHVERRRKAIAFAFMFSALIATQQRTAIIASVVGIAALYVLQIGQRRVLRFLVVMSAVGVVAAILWLLAENLGADTLLQMLPQSAQAMFGEQTTFTWRERLSEEFLNDYVTNWGIFKQLFGALTGTSFNFYSEVTDEYYNVTPHNGYIYFLSRGGAIGVACIILLYFKNGLRFLAGGRQGIEGGIMTPAFQVAVTVAMATWFWGYTMAPEHAIFFGIALGLVLRGPTMETQPRANHNLANPVYAKFKIGTQE